MPEELLHDKERFREGKIAVGGVQIDNCCAETVSGRLGEEIYVSDRTSQNHADL